MTASDFPAGTKFFVKGADGPYTIVPGPRPIKFRTFSFASGAKASSAATGVSLRGCEVSVEEFLAEVEKSSRPKLLTVEEFAALKAKWETAGRFSTFPVGTRFYTIGGEVPIVELPKGEVATWFGGVLTKWDHDQLVFARSESKKNFQEVDFPDFVRVVAESVGNTVDKIKLLEMEMAPRMAQLKADRAFALKRPAVDHDDFMYCRPDRYGIWRDSDGDPI